ncbi:MAG: hypothetical protein RR553_08585 [Akkermansia sp.]
MGRSRRKHQLQIKKRTSWKKIFVMIGLSILGLIFLLALVCYFLINSYLSGDDFRAMLEKQAARGMKVNSVAIAPLEWGGSSLGTSSLTAQGNGVLRDLKISGFEAEINRAAILDRHIEVKNISMESVSINLQKAPSPSTSSPLTTPQNLSDEPSPSTPKSRIAPLPPLTSSDKQTQAPSTGSEQSNWLKEHFMPTQYSLDKASIQRVNLSYKDGDKLYALNNVSLTITPEQNNQEYRIFLQGGAFILPDKWISSGTIQSALLRYRTDRISGSDFRVTLGEGGYLDVEGEWNFINNQWWASLVVRDVNCANILPKNWSKKIEGIVQGTARLRQESKGTLEASGSVKINKGVLTALPILDTMAAFTGTSKFRRIQFNTAEANYEYSQGDCNINNIILASNGLLRIEGDIQIDKDKSLRGHLKVGVLPGLLSNIPGAEEKIFLQENNKGKMGLYWANVNISGTTDHPREDLSARLITAAGERIFASLPDKASKVLLFTENIASKLLGNKNKDSESETKSETKLAPSDTPSSRESDTQPQEKPKKKHSIDKALDALDSASKIFGL